jgi:hypothetical protein
MLYGTWSLLTDAVQLLRGVKPVNPYTLLLTLAAPFVTGGAAWTAYSAANKNRLLRGECRYTVAQVYENTRIKGAKVSRYTYQVQGVRYEDQQEVDWLGGWRPLGSRWYLRFAVPDPDVHEHPGPPVPATVTLVPAAGWARRPAAR